MRTRTVAALALALAACGDTLVDHQATDIRDQAQPTTCRPGTATCPGVVTGTVDCLPELPTRCGASCDDCTAIVTPPAGAEVACLPNVEAPSTCGSRCQDGFLNCGDACCGAIALAGGAAHTCAVTSDGRLLCWGRNAEGQVTGTPTASPVLTPHEVFAAGVTAVAAGTAHTCATVSGEVRCFGGDPAREAPATRAVNAVELAAGDRHTCAREASGRVTCWGATDLNQTGGGTPIAADAAALAAGAEHTCALLASGRVACWGTNANGELGTGSAGGSSATPQTPLGLDAFVAAIGAGAHHACAAPGTQTTPLRCWGANPTGANGAVLPELPDPQASPAEPIKGGDKLVRFEVAVVAGGRVHTCIQRSGESLKCFGADNAAGQLGIGAPGELADAGTPLPAPSPTSVFAIGGDHGCVAAPTGALSCWGSNAFGQLGDGTTTTPPVGTHVRVLGR